MTPPVFNNRALCPPVIEASLYPSRLPALAQLPLGGVSSLLSELEVSCLGKEADRLRGFELKLR